MDNSTHAMVPRDEEDVPNPWLTLTPAELEARRRHNKRLLDALEEEERQEEERAAERERAQHQQDLAKRKEAARDEIERLKAQRELQKRMGKALMRNMAAAREREEKREQEVIQDGHAACTENAKRLKPRKSVSFAELPENAPKDGGGARTAPLEWGDVAPGRLIGRDDTLAKRSRQDRAPMKYDVVERFPNRCVKPTIVSVEGDSDDESDPGLLSPNDHTDRNDAHSDSESTDTLADENDDSKGQEEAGDTALLEEEYDFDSAQHQREVALRYFEQRGTIGKDALEAMTSHSHEEGEHEWDQPVSDIDDLNSCPH